MSSAKWRLFGLGLNELTANVGLSWYLGKVWCIVVSDDMTNSYILSHVSMKMQNKLYVTFYPWCRCIKTCCLYSFIRGCMPADHNSTGRPTGRAPNKTKHFSVSRCEILATSSWPEWNPIQYALLYRWLSVCPATFWSNQDHIQQHEVSSAGILMVHAIYACAQVTTAPD